MSAAITAAAVGTAGAIYSAKQAAKARAGGGTVSRSPWLEAGSRSAVERADQIANRQYTPFQGDRVAGLSANEQQSNRMASAFSDKTRLAMDRGFQAGDLNQFKNPYLEQVLGNQRRVIGEDFSRQGAALSANQSATDAFRSGRSDLARARLGDSRMRALGDAEARGQASGFDSAMNNYFANQANQRANLDTATGALNVTGAADRSVQQANKDFDYNQFLEKRDWDISNLQPLLQSLQAAQGGAMTNTTQRGASSSPWGAAAGLLSTAIGQYGKYRAPPPKTGGTNSSVANFQGASGYDSGYTPGGSINTDTVYDTANTGDGGEYS